MAKKGQSRAKAGKSTRGRNQRTNKSKAAGRRRAGGRKTKGNRPRKNNRARAARKFNSQIDFSWKTTICFFSLLRIE